MLFYLFYQNYLFNMHFIISVSSLHNYFPFEISYKYVLLTANYYSKNIHLIITYFVYNTDIADKIKYNHLIHFNICKIFVSFILSTGNNINIEFVRFKHLKS